MLALIGGLFCLLPRLVAAETWLVQEGKARAEIVIAEKPVGITQGRVNFHNPETRKKIESLRQADLGRTDRPLIAPPAAHQPFVANSASVPRRIGEM